MKFSLSLITDTLFSAFISFLLFCIVANGFLPTPYSVICSFALSIIFAVFVFNRISKKQQKASLKKLDQKRYEQTVFQLNLMTKLELVTFFESLLEQKNIKTEKKHGGIYLTEKNIFLFFKFGFENVTKADIVRIFNIKQKFNTTYVISENFNEEVKSFSLRFKGLTVVNSIELYSYLKDNNFFPEDKKKINQEQPKKLKALKSIIDRKKAKTFALYGIVFLFMSYFVVLKIYYLICSTIFFILSLICLLFGEKKIKNT